MLCGKTISVSACLFLVASMFSTSANSAKYGTAEFCYQADSRCTKDCTDNFPIEATEELPADRYDCYELCDDHLNDCLDRSGSVTQELTVEPGTSGPGLKPKLDLKVPADNLNVR